MVSLDLRWKIRVIVPGAGRRPESAYVRESLLERTHRRLDGALVPVQVWDHLDGLEAVAGDVRDHRLVALPPPRPGQLAQHPDGDPAGGLRQYALGARQPPDRLHD